MGGSHDGALVVRVTEPAEGGRATRAALRVLAVSLGVPPRSVTLVRGPTSRRKVVEVAVTAEREEPLRGRLGELLRASD